MILLGCSVEGRFIEQHDIYFGIGEGLSELKDEMMKSWNAIGLHIDAWREVTVVDGYEIKVVDKTDAAQIDKDAGLYFINLGGYKENEFEEFHFKMLIIASDPGEAVRKAKQSLFYKNTGVHGAGSHIDDKYGVDVDDLFQVEDILSLSLKEKFSLSIKKNSEMPEDSVNLGYLIMSKL